MPLSASTALGYFINVIQLVKCTSKNRISTPFNSSLGIKNGSKGDYTTFWKYVYTILGLYSILTSPNTIGIIKSRRRLARHIASMGEKINAYIILVGTPEGMSPARRSRRRWEDNIRMDVREMGWVGVDWIQLARDRD
jgi:hypothetical protein